MSDGQAVEADGVKASDCRPAEVDVLAPSNVVEFRAKLVVRVGGERREVSDADGVDPAESEVRDNWIGRLEAFLAAHGSEEGGEGVFRLALRVRRARSEEVVCRPRAFAAVAGMSMTAP